jgi:4'-phosphopantetheinyl transferase
MNVANDDVHIWVVGGHQTSTQVDQVKNVLSIRELKRAELLRGADRDLFIISRGRLKEIIAKYERCSANAVQLIESAFGKPNLINSLESLRFSVSHSGSVVLVAITRKREVGVDVEKVRTVIEAGRVATKLFSASDVSRLSKLPGTLALREYFRCWTRMEALAKGRGQGLLFSNAK